MDYNQLMLRAAAKGDLERVKHCYAQLSSCDVNMALEAAAEGGHLSTIDFLLSVGASPNSGLNGACLSNNEVLITKFIGVGADDFKWAFNRSAQAGHLELVKRWLDYDPNLDCEQAAIWAMRRDYGGPHEEVLKYFEELHPGVTHSSVQQICKAM